MRVSLIGPVGRLPCLTNRLQLVTLPEEQVQTRSGLRRLTKRADPSQPEH